MDAWKQLITISMIVLIVSIQGACNNSPQYKSASANRNSFKTPVVNAISLERVDYTIETATYFGTLQPNRQAFLGFSIAGEIATMAAVGDRFAKGDKIASLQNSELQQRRSEIEQNLESAKSAQQADSIGALQVELSSIDAAIERTQIKAPYECAVSQLLSFDGGLIEANKPAVKIVEVGRPNVEISLPRRVAQWISPQQSYNFVIGKTVKQGTLLRRSVTENPIGNSTLWFELEELTDIDAMFGSIVECRFNMRTEETGFWVPLEALNHGGQGIWSVMILNPLSSQTEKNLGKAEKRLVQIKQVEGQRVLVDGGISAGELVIADGLHRIVVGQTARMNLINAQATVARNPGTEP